MLHDLKSKQSIDRKTCQEINYSSNLSDKSYCLWANRNFPLLVRREIRTRQLHLRGQSLSFPLPPSLFSFISPCSSLAAAIFPFVNKRCHLKRSMPFLRTVDAVGKVDARTSQSPALQCRQSTLVTFAS